MKTEIEAKFLDVDKDAIRAALKKVGGRLVSPERLMRRTMFDFTDERLDAINAWIRVRDEGNGLATMSYKRLHDRTLHGTKEVTLRVDNFEAACDFLRALGLNEKAYQETKRESWKLDDVEVELDTWPWIPSFVELEGPSEQALRDVAQRLCLNWTAALHGSVETAYQKYYDVTEKEIDHWERITFTPVPEWLEQKRRKN